MPGKIAVAHHSVADWDFQIDPEHRSLSASAYVSPPTSLLYLKSGGYVLGSCLCRIPATLCLPQGEVRNWTRTGLTAKYPALFRSQAALGTADRQNCYFVAIDTDTAYLRRYVDDVLTERDDTPCWGVQNQWVHYRIFWYNGLTPGEAEALCVDVYLDVEGEWIKQGATMYDTDNMWKDSAINRAGFFPIAGGNLPMYWDNTEIWGPV